MKPVLYSTGRKQSVNRSRLQCRKARLESQRTIHGWGEMVAVMGGQRRPRPFVHRLGNHIGWDKRSASHRREIVGPSSTPWARGHPPSEVGPGLVRHWGDMWINEKKNGGFDAPEDEVFCCLERCLILCTIIGYLKPAASRSRLVVKIVHKIEQRSSSPCHALPADRRASQVVS